MAEDSGAVRGFWCEDGYGGAGPLVVFSQIQNTTVEDLEAAVMAVVNDVMELAEGGNPPSSNDFGMAAGDGSSAAAPSVAPVPTRAR